LLNSTILRWTHHPGILILERNKLMLETSALGLRAVSSRDIALGVEKRLECSCFIMQLVVNKIKVILLTYRPLITLLPILIA
jgi:hypothetical protein